MRISVEKILLIMMLFVLAGVWSACKEKGIPAPPADQGQETIGSTLATVTSDVQIVTQATKINQITGETDLERQVPVSSRTLSRYRLEGTDLGVPVTDSDGKRTWLFFGDTWGGNDGLQDALGYTDQTSLESGLTLDFASTSFGVWKPIYVDRISRGGFEVPAEGIMDGETMYLYYTTDHTSTKTMGRSILSKASRQELNNANFKYVYDFSTNKFINLSIVKVKNADWSLLPQNGEEGMVIFGSGDYRKSNIYLAYQPLKSIENRSTLLYYAGVKDGKPVWVKNESWAQPIFKFPTTPAVGELSASYNKYLKRWILLFNHDSPRGINMRTAEFPWGPWSDAKVIFRPWEDKGYCYFIHTSWDFRQCDNVMEPATRKNEWGGEYGPYQFENLAIGDETAGTSTIYFTMSTWNPYQAVLMKADLKRL